MATFAAQVTVAVKTAQQFSQLARWAAQLQSIQQLGARLNRLTTVPEIASAIATELRVLINYDNIRVYRLDGEDLNAVALNATDDLYLDETPEDVRSRVGQGITGWVAEHGIAQNLPNTTIDPRTEDIPGSDIFDESMLLAPLLYEDRVLGVIALSSRGLNQFEDDDLRLLEIYASIAAQAMANADATDQLRAQSERLQRQLRSQRELLELTESILSTLDPRAVLGQIADRLGRLVRYDTLAIDLHDRQSGAVLPLRRIVRMGTHSDSEGPRTAWRPGSSAITKRDSCKAQPSTTAATTAASWSRSATATASPGVLTLSRTLDVEPFTSDEFDLVQLFAAQVSIALQNAETHRAVEVRAQTDDLTGLLNHGSLREWLSRDAAAGQPVQPDHAGPRRVQGRQRRLRAPGRRSPPQRNRRCDRGRGSRDRSRLPLRRRRVRRPPPREPMLALRCRSRSEFATAVHRVGHPGLHGSDVDITASIGVATFPEDGATGADILLAADRACFVAKRGGRDRIADAAKGLFLAAEFSLQEPTPVDSSDPRWTAASAAFRSDRRSRSGPGNRSPRPNPRIALDAVAIGRARRANRDARTRPDRPFPERGPAPRSQGPRHRGSR